ncbi:LOW QUALITY PROTEIN: membrane protein, major facilitator superfamily [Citrifermentans bemidjiense Bem]|uniref:Membrane protein, major facilitator superfamily n=1 Tax=Citrifermentans bemidjiense (strain ATCC BAA-1014 / DSM 16622 / JCM 12645 / Bem) TaxID=404380 RepID=E1P683_CITBB|nr:LOW QUALITY PROTEIN: membrane protein, major facilitator superfamily [Citrifermentans bemidjiense Bem]
MSKTTSNKGWQVVMAGTGINLALGVLYAWSIFKGAIKASIEKGGPDAFQWSLSSINDPYALCCLAFAFSMILAGKCQDKIGPAKTALIGGILVGAGFSLMGYSNSYAAWVTGFGVLAGSGFGFGYSAATPPALKWFSSKKTGLIAGIVVAGFGLAPVYIAPLSSYLLGAYGIQQSMYILAAGFAVIVCGLSFALANPPKGFVPAEPVMKGEEGKPTPAKKAVHDATVSEMLRSPKFYMLWTTFFIGAGAGLMVIGSVAGLAKKSMGPMAFVAVAIMAIGNASGRVVAGVLSDKIGRRATLTIMLSFQAVLMFAAVPVVGSGSAMLLVLLASLIGFNYGSNLTLFPSFAKDYWGFKNYGLNYGVLFSAWGVGGLVMGRVSEMMNAQPGGLNKSFILAGSCLALGTIVTFFLREKKAVAVEATEVVGEKVAVKVSA